MPTLSSLLLYYGFAVADTVALLSGAPWPYAAAGLAATWGVARVAPGGWRLPCSCAVFTLFFGFALIHNGSWLPGMMPILVVLMEVVPQAAKQTPLSELWSCTSATSCDWPSAENEIVLFESFFLQWLGFWLLAWLARAAWRYAVILRRRRAAGDAAASPRCP